MLVCEDGDALTLVLQDDGSTKIDVERRAVPSGFLYVDGIVGDVGQGVLRDRRNLAEEGLVVVIVTVDSTTGEVVTGPEIVTRGWVYAPEAEELLEEAKAAVLASLQGGGRRGRHRLRHPPPPLPPVAGQVHQRAHQAAARGHPGRHGGLTPDPPPSNVVAVSAAAGEPSWVGVMEMLLWVVVGGVSFGEMPATKTRRGRASARSKKKPARKPARRKTTAAKAKAASAEPGMLARSREAAGRQLAGHRADVLAVCLFVAGAIFALGLWTELAGPVGSALADGTGAVLGRARVAVPVACFAFGVVLLWPRRPARRRRPDDEDTATTHARPSRRRCASPSARCCSSSPTSASCTSPTGALRSAATSTTCATPAARSARMVAGAARRRHRRRRRVADPRRHRAGRRCCSCSGSRSA